MVRVLVSLLSLAVLVGVAAAIPAPCCTDRQFQAVISRVGGVAYPITGNNVFVDGYQETGYDFYRKRIGAVWHQRQPDGSMKNVSYLLDYNTDRQFVYEDGKCTITKIGMPLTDPCIPANATFMGTAVLGFGTESFMVNTWEYMEAGNVIKVTVTDKGCVPVLSARYGTVDKVSSEMVEVYSSFKPGIDDPSSMDPSKYDSMCTTVDDTDDSGSLVGRRSVFSSFAN